MSIILNLVVLFGFITLIFLSPACMNVGLVRTSNDDYSISSSELLLCCIPFFNHFYGWKRYSNSYISLSGISSILLVISFISRVVVMYSFFSNDSLQTVTVLIFLIAIALFWILNAVNIYTVLSDSGLYTFGRRLFYAFTVIIGQIIVGYYMPRNMYYYQKKEKGSLYVRD